MERIRLMIGGMLLCLLAGTEVSRARTIPKSVTAVESFDSKRYLGTWYEIARLNTRFERNLNNTSSNYTLNGDGTMRVVHQGYNYKSGQWREMVGKLRFVSDADEARMQVSFFGPLSMGYNVIAIDPDYEYALVAGKSRQFLWLLSRQKSIPEDIKEEYLRKAESLGFRTSELIWVEHDQEQLPVVAGR